MPLQPNQIVNNRYQIVALLGQGGMGAVYQAQDLRLDQIVALKENIGGDARQFQQEALLLAGLRHPNLPRVIDHFVESNGAQYLAMDFIAGDDLETRLRQQGALTQTEALTWLNQILDAVAYLHAQGVIHRDIKPANIKITPQDRAVLVDFGIAKIYQPGRATMTGARAATPGYAAPEQYRGGTDPRSDVYSLGATLYALLVGGDPPDAQALERGIATLTPPSRLNVSVSAQIEQVILRAMAAMPQNRFQSVAEMQRALTVPSINQLPYQPSMPTYALPTTTVAVGQGNQNRIKVTLGLASTILIVCLLCVGGYLALNNAFGVAKPTETPTRALAVLPSPVLPTVALVSTVAPTKEIIPTVAPTATPMIKPTNSPPIPPSPTYVAAVATATSVPPTPTTPLTAACSNPQAQITYPRMNSIVQRGSILQVIGTADLPSFNYYRVQFQPDGGTDWGILYTGKQTVENSVLMEWHTNTVGVGTYWLRLIVEDPTGNYPEPCVVKIVIQ